MNVHFIPVPQSTDAVIVYRSDAGIAFVGNRALERQLTEGLDAAAENLAPEIKTFLLDIGFWNNGAAFDDPAAQPFQPATAVLLLTNQCSLRCGYCYADAGSRPARTLDLSHAIQAIDHVCDQARGRGLDHFRLDFHGGGEPTSAWPLLTRCTEYARSRTMPAIISLTSNGVWSPRQRDWIIANVDDLSISVDGRPAVQDRNRPLPNGAGSAGIVYDNLSALDAAGRRFGVRITATAPWHGLHEDVAYLCQFDGCLTIQIEPAFAAPRGGHNTDPTTEACAGFADAFLRAFDIGSAAGRHVFFSGARPGITGATFCSAPYMALIVGPGGNLTTCYEVDSKEHPLFSLSHIGRIDDSGIVVDQNQRAELHRRLGERHASCDGCFCKHTCAGDCYTRTFQPGADGHLMHGARCDMNRDITREILLRLIEDGGGVWRSPQFTGPCHAIG